jgi:hypothetical protein
LLVTVRLFKEFNMPSGNSSRLSIDFARLALLSQEVIALRLLRIAFGGVGAQREVRRMFIEKATTGSEAAFAFASGGPTAAAAVYRKAVAANRKRLAS